ncbi:MAG TPA: FtsK/SpoIIIE domain-containing protein [Isosphaeraceae bacterium]|nr:FtsK/SpoIIIE domain-containing protein [Isosphaeraceae bacterium]
MPASPLIPLQSEVLHDLTKLADRRARDEVAVRDFAAKEAAEKRDYEEKKEELEQGFAAAKAKAEASYAAARSGLEADAAGELARAEQEYQKQKKTISGRCQNLQHEAKKKRDDTRWEAGTIFDAARDSAKKRFEKAERQVAADMEAFAPLGASAKRLIESCRQFTKAGQAVALIPDPPAVDPLRELQEAIGRVDSLQKELDRKVLPKLLRWKNIPWVMLLLALCLFYPAFRILGAQAGAIASVIGGVALGIGLRFALLAIAQKQVASTFGSLCEALAAVEAWSQRCHDRSAALLQRQKNESTERRDNEMRRADETCTMTLVEAERTRDTQLRALETNHAQRTSSIKNDLASALAQTKADHERTMAALQARFDSQMSELESKHASFVAANRAAYEKAWNELSNRWRGGIERANQTVAEIDQDCARLFFDWFSKPLDAWVPPEEIPSAMRFGQFKIEMRQIPGGIAHDERLRALAPEAYTFPALIPFPTVGSLLIKTFGAGREIAVQLLQAVMLRYLTSLPAGKVRLTIIDPVGLGQNFSAFMHMTDYDEAFVTSRIWTEPSHIEQRLTDLTDHMENVIQKYLRNEFETIEQYNLQAGEVAEPFRFLVVANFPANFSDSAMKRLLSIAASGARCGVYTLISVDMQQSLPQGFSLKELEPHALCLQWLDQRYLWKRSEFEPYALTLDKPPTPELFSPLVHLIGAKAKAAKRVEVPFDYIAPPPDRWWTSNSSAGIDVPLGRAGATRWQHLKLGKGTSQHVLIAGRTGSGKSTLLHALITNLALHYSPEEVEMYLIDFKKGVEFKTYATYELPHARVVAIESEREFGLSVLQRLDAELRIRGEKFRDLGAQDLASYREANGNKPTPRILLMVDEFQEFFVEDDKVAQEAALLLDRLVRQGRAFGIHVHLGSQTLSGAYSLARSTLGQMAVRIALQCSEGDAHLILSEENPAARLLSRPGEAIYNDANGMVEGNNIFQVVWLAEDRREDYLKRIHALACERNMIPREPQIVFEGNLPANPSKNVFLNQLLTQDNWPEPPRAARAWLGDAVAIKDPTAAAFRPQSGSNMLIIGQQDDSALGMMTMSLVSLVAQYSPQAGARFYLFDGTPVDSPHYGYLGRLPELLPHSVENIGWRELPGVIGQIAEEVERRLSAAGSEGQPIYLFVYDLQRFRDLRKADDDFGFSGGSEKPSTAKQFATIVRDGPPVGVHTIVWCDNLNNLNRCLERATLREFEMRVLFQMSANDSSTLIDSPLANKLGANRAIFHSEEQGTVEKFRPYAVPTSEWQSSLAAKFASRPQAQTASPVAANAPATEPLQSRE